MYRSRIPEVESRLGSTWHRLNHNRAIKSPFQQCWTVKPERIQLVWSKIHQFLLSGWKLTVCFLWVCLLTFPRTESCFPLHLGQMTVSTCSQLGRESSGGTLLVPPGHVARRHPFPPTLTAPTVLQPGQDHISQHPQCKRCHCFKKWCSTETYAFPSKKVLPFLSKYWLLLLG